MKRHATAALFLLVLLAASASAQTAETNVNESSVLLSLTEYGQVNSIGIATQAEYIYTARCHCVSEWDPAPELSLLNMGDLTTIYGTASCAQGDVVTPSTWSREGVPSLLALLSHYIGAQVMTTEPLVIPKGTHVGWRIDNYPKPDPNAYNIIPEHQRCTVTHGFVPVIP